MYLHANLWQKWGLSLSHHLDKDMPRLVELVKVGVGTSTCKLWELMVAAAYLLVWFLLIKLPFLPVDVHVTAPCDQYVASGLSFWGAVIKAGTS